MNVLELINIGSKELRQNKIVTFRLDSEILLSKILKKKREEMLVNLNQKICEKKLFMYKELIKRRSKNEPIAYVKACCPCAISLPNCLPVL